MKAILTTSIFVLFCSLFSYSQAVVCVNKTACPLDYHVVEVVSGTCTIVQTHIVTVPAYSAATVTASAPGTEFNRAQMTFVNNNCVSMNLAAPNNNCVTCPITWLQNSYSTTVNCNNNCQGTTFHLKWFDCNYPGMGVPHIGVWQ